MVKKSDWGVWLYLGVRDFVHTNNELDLYVDSGKYFSVDFYTYFPQICSFRCLVKYFPKMLIFSQIG